MVRDDAISESFTIFGLVLSAFFHFFGYCFEYFVSMLSVAASCDFCLYC